MPKDLTVVLANRPGTLAEASEAVGRAGINMLGACGFPAGDEGIFHILVENAEGARGALEAAGQTVRDERDVVLTTVEDVPGGLGRVLQRVADVGINVDLIYLTAGGQLVLGADDVEGARRVLST